MATTQTAFDGKICVITGAGSGIGRALAISLAQSGAILALSDLNQDGLDETLKLCSVDGSNRISLDILDVADADAIETYVEIITKRYGAANYLFNVAGLTRVGEFADTPLASFEKIMDVNFWGVVRMTKAFLPQLINTRGGVINISSLFGLVGYPGQAHYCASKFAVRGFSETIAAELFDKGVSVTSVHPGGVATNIVRNAKVDNLPETTANKNEIEESFDQIARTTPEKAAQIILNGAARRRRRVIVGADAKILSFIQRLFPSGYHRAISSFLSQN